MPSELKKKSAMWFIYNADHQSGVQLEDQLD